MTALNDAIVSALDATYGPADITTLLGRWMDDNALPRWSTDAMREFFIDETGADPSLGFNDLAYLYFSGGVSPGLDDARLLESGDFRLLESGDFRLLESA